MPWSCAAEMKWVCTSPFVDRPQTRSCPTAARTRRSSDASRSDVERGGDRARPPRPAATASSGPRRTAAGRCPPAGPAGTSRRSGSPPSAEQPIVTPTHRQPRPSASRVSTGRNTSWPLAVAAVSAPVTRPRLATNHRVATVLANTVAMQPEPVPTTSPHSRNRCQGWVICVVSSAPTEITASATIVTRRNPKRCCSAAANGPMNPNSSTLMPTAKPTVARLQPNSSRSGSISTLGVLRKPAAPSSVMNDAAEDDPGVVQPPDHRDVAHGRNLRYNGGRESGSKGGACPRMS